MSFFANKPKKKKTCPDVVWFLVVQALSETSLSGYFLSAVCFLKLSLCLLMCCFPITKCKVVNLKSACFLVSCSVFPLDEDNSRHVVVNCSEALLKNNTYWPLVSDFINILSHQSVAKKFLEDHSLLMLWMSFVSFFQGKS